MGYTKTDELSINTIRVLAVSHWLLFTPPSRGVCFGDCGGSGGGSGIRLACPLHPSIHPSISPVLTSKGARPETAHKGQLLTQSPYLGRCDRPCQLWSPRCPYVRFCALHVSRVLTDMCISRGVATKIRAASRQTSHLRHGTARLHLSFTGAWHQLPTFSSTSS